MSGIPIIRRYTNPLARKQGGYLVYSSDNYDEEITQIAPIVIDVNKFKPKKYL
jgi:hypothetical protein